MNVEYIDHMGTDLSVVNAARVSFDKESKEFGGNDKRLISYLANHNHWTPFAHTAITLRIKAPVAIRTQCFKHKQGFVENEVSRRYVDDEPEVFIPDQWRGRPTEGAKQGSAGYVNDPTMDRIVREHLRQAIDTYNNMIAAGVAPEQARFVLPQGTYTQWFWTGSLAAYARFYKQRTDPHAQKEIQDLAGLVGNIIQPLFPVSWEALTT